MFQTLLDEFFKSEEGARWLAPNMVVGRAGMREFVDWLESRTPTQRAADVANVAAISVSCPRCGLTFSEPLDESPRR